MAASADGGRVHVKKLEADHWVQGRQTDAVVERPAWQQIERAIKTLDASQYTIVILEQSDWVHMGIGGGGGRYVVYIQNFGPDDESVSTLQDLSKSDGEREQFVVGGQLSDFSARSVVGLDETLRAAKAFYDTGEVDPSLSWQIQGGG
jgi:hypothetical protein